MKFGLAITTHSSENTPKNRFRIIEQCFQSILDNKPDDLEVVIVSDGIIEEHKDIIEKFPFHHEERETNGGISRAKNTCLRYLMESGCDVLFLADDDIIIKSPELFSVYSDAIQKTKLTHFCGWFLSKNNCKVININDVDVLKTEALDGKFLVFTKELINQIGYFKVLPYAYGHEHTNFTCRAIKQGHIPYFCDINCSNDYITIDAQSWSNDANSMGSIDQDGIHENEKLAFLDLSSFVELEE